MPRPVLQRTAKTYRRHVEELTRLRTAVFLDTETRPSDQAEAAELIDALLKWLSKKMAAIPSSE